MSAEYRAAFAATVFRSLLDRLALAEPERSALLASAGLSDASFQHGEGYLSWAEVQALVSQILLLPLPPGLALLAGARVLPPLHGSMGLAAMSADTLADAMRIFDKYMATRAQVLEVAVSEDGPYGQIRFTLLPPADAVTRFLMEAIIASCHACINFLLNEPVQGGEVHFPWPAPGPEEQALYAQVFAGCRCCFDAPLAQIRVPIAYLPRSLLSRDSELHALAGQQCDALHQRLQRQALLSGQIQKQLAEAAGHLPTLADMAQSLGMSTRTLIRRLHQEGTRYQELVDSETSRRAAFLMRLPGATVAAVAAELGYAEPASFRRAFRRWFGVSPSDFRG